VRSKFISLHFLVYICIHFRQSISSLEEEKSKEHAGVLNEKEEKIQSLLKQIEEERETYKQDMQAEISFLISRLDDKDSIISSLK
jgi:flagellar biosynthesis chaperone FliJ